ncbi:crossover junction endodeoxyribonuclease RuvC [Candidatus Peregrinibacteria bacterium]|nr:crossover junction endodeoxyribonuclease RuvC [Candidatus Peregrinibacteria bacterium]
MRILGIDPGTATTGYGIIEEYNDEYKVLNFGCIKTKAEKTLEDRLKEIASDIDFLIKKYKPQQAAIEEIFFSKNTKTAIAVAHARGVIIQKLSENNVPVSSYNPLKIKQAVCSDGKAKKQQIIKMTQILLKLNTAPSPDDAADALAIALCHGNFIRNKALYS